MKQLLRIALSAVALLFVASPALAQSLNDPNSISTSQQLSRSLGNFVFTTPSNASAAQISGTGIKTASRDRNAPRRDNLQAVEFAGGHLSGLIGGFEQGAGFGFGVELSSADSIPGIVFRAKLLTSTKFYRRFEGEAYIPKIGSEKTHASIWFNYLYRSKDHFFNIGPRSPETPETNFAMDERSYNFSLYHDLADGFQVGVYARVANTNGFRGENDKDIPIDTLFSGKPTTIPITKWLPGLNTNAKIFSYGVFGEFDKRSNESGLTKGAYGYARFASLDGLKNDLFDDFGWTEVELDGRVYIPIFSNSTSLALRGASELKDPKRGSQIPFYEQAYFGGRSHGRGFANYRFRGNNSVLFSVEPRQTVWRQKDTRGLDVFVFGDFGQVWGDNRSRTDPVILANDKSGSGNWRTGAGAGFQYRWNKSVAIRIDYGRSNETSRVYFSMSRGF
ncbi:MAG: BamA/TamA family outer membrane protein [Acidobacteria bacterium]|nr:BamA/TamA family outer membrane protein [Acidobacteriota bacterium]